MTMRRESSSVTVTFADSASLSGAFSLEGAATAQVIMPSAWTAARLGFKVSDSVSGTFVPLYTDTGALVQITSPAASKAYNAPSGVYNARFAKLWSMNSTGTAVIQTAARTVTLVLKS